MAHPRLSGAPERVVCADPASAAEAAAERVASLVLEVVAERGECSLALAGGGTPRLLYARLREREDLPWARLAFYFGDERCVPADDPQSNYAMAHEALLSRPGIDPERVFRIRGEAAEREAAAAEYAALLPARLDLVLLGIGEDGHTASLFPGQEALAERERRVVVVRGPKPPPWRLSVTAPVIEAAREIYVLATGAGKAGPVARALAAEGEVREVPARLARRGVWFLDRAAAGELPADRAPGGETQ